MTSEAATDGGKRHVYLTGFMGAGKSAVGRELAARLGLRFVDLDDRIVERAGREIATIFDELGEATFRDLESEELGRVADEAASVVATGGGVVERASNVRRMEATGTVVYLKADFDLLARRAGTDRGPSRPLFRDPEAARRRLRRRRPAYERCELSVELDAAQSPRDIAALIAGELSACAT